MKKKKKKKKENTNTALNSYLSNYKSLDSEKQLKQCYCQAQVHPLVGNCLHCGRIVCEVEKKCSFCNKEPTKPNAYCVNPYLKDLVDPQEEISLNKAIELKNKLLSFEAKKDAQTRIIDESTDWFAEAQNIWLHEDQRKVAHEQGVAEDFKDKNVKQLLIGVNKQGEFYKEFAVVEDLDVNTKTNAFLQQLKMEGEQEMSYDEYLNKVTKNKVNPIQKSEVYNTLYSVFDAENTIKH